MSCVCLVCPPFSPFLVGGLIKFFFVNEVSKYVCIYRGAGFYFCGDEIRKFLIQNVSNIILCVGVYTYNTYIYVSMYIDGVGGLVVKRTT